MLYEFQWGPSRVAACAMISSVIHRLNVHIRRGLNRLGLALTPAQRSQRRLRSITLGPEDTVIDCGANVGVFTEVLARGGATVYAFEPNPEAYEVLRNRFRDRANVHCRQQGVFDEAGTMSLYLHENSDQDPVTWSTGSSFLDFKGNVRRDAAVDVEVIDLIAFIRDLARPIKVLKMDVEGVECRILTRMIEDGAIDDVQHAFVEVHDDTIPELKNETQALRSLIVERGLAAKIDLDW